MKNVRWRNKKKRKDVNRMNKMKRKDVRRLIKNNLKNKQKKTMKDVNNKKLKINKIRWHPLLILQVKFNHKMENDLLNKIMKMKQLMDS